VRGVAPFQPFRWQGRLLIAPGLYDFRARLFSTELGAFLQPDEYDFLSHGGTLWSWPGQNPFRWRDPSGRFAPGGIAAGVIAAGEGAAAAAAAGVAGAFAVAGGVGFGLGYFGLGDVFFEAQDQNLNAIARAAARDNQGRPNPAASCNTDAGGGSAKVPPTATGDVSAAAPDPRLPRKAIEALRQIQETRNSPPGFRGGREFANDGRGNGEILPRVDAKGNPITYREWDVNQFRPGVNRGAERLVTGTDGSAYYTADHYGTFVRIP